MGTAQGKTLLQRMQERWHRLDSVYNRGFKATHEEIANVYLPWTGAFQPEQRNDGWVRNEDIIDNSPELSVRILSAGLTAGASSPARPWFKMGVRDPALSKKHAVRLWLDDVTRIILQTFSRSNAYRALQQIYTECPLYGTAAALVVPDAVDGIHVHVLTAGQYRISTNPKGEVVVLYREFEMTVGQLVREFGLEKCSDRVQSLWTEGDLEEGVTVVHGIEPRSDRDIRMRDNKNMPWRSVYWEVGENQTDVRNVLRESGFMRFPAVVPRWSVNPKHDYGNGPGVTALGDVIQLQQEQYRKAQLIDQASDPAVLLPSDMKHQEVDLGPGGKNYTDATGSNTARPIWQVGQQLQPLLEDLQDVRTRIRSAWFADMFLMVAQTDKNMTATEVAERHEEKLLMLGPALERLHNELLEPLVTLTFHYLMEAGALPPPPEELSDAVIDIEFISMLAQTQRAVGAKSIDRYVATLMSVAPAKEEVLDRLDVDAFAEDLADRLGVPAELLVSRNDAEEIRRARNEQRAAQAQADMGQQQAAIAKDVATASSLAPVPPEQQFSQVAGSS